MKKEQDYIRDIAEIRSMMERTSKFVSLSGWAGIMAGIFALSGAYLVARVFEFNPKEAVNGNSSSYLTIVLLGAAILMLALCTAVYFSYKRAVKRNEKLWNPVAKQLLLSMAVPLIAGGLLILILLSQGLAGLAAPLSLVFYGLALFSAGKFTYSAVQVLGIVELVLGLISSYWIEYGILFWALGFGAAHIVYGIYVYYRYER